MSTCAARVRQRMTSDLLVRGGVAVGIAIVGVQRGQQENRGEVQSDG